MKKNYKKGLALLMALALTATASGAPAAEAAAKKPALSAKKKTLYYNGTKKFTLKVKKNAAKKIVATKWKTSNKKVAAISKAKKTSVVVTAKKKGTAKITANVTYKQGKKTKKVKLTCTITSKKKAASTGTGNTGTSATATPNPGTSATATPTPGTSATPTPTPNPGTATATPEPGTATATPEPGTATATPEPSTATATPEPGTATATPTPSTDPSVTGGAITGGAVSGEAVEAVVDGTAYLDAKSEVTVTFKGVTAAAVDCTVTINDVEIEAEDDTIGLATVKSIADGDEGVVVTLEMAPMNGWHKLVGSYVVALTKDDEELAKATVEYDMDELSDDTGYHSINLFLNGTTDSPGDAVRSWYKVEGTKMYLLSIIKQDKIHCDGVNVGDTSFKWFQGANQELRLVLNGTTYTVGSHVFQDKWANPVSWGGDTTLMGTPEEKEDPDDPDSAVIKDADWSKIIRSYMALATFDDDTDTDKGCALLNVVDLANIDLDESAVADLEFGFAGFVGQSGTDKFCAVDESQTYNANGVVVKADDEE